MNTSVLPHVLPLPEAIDSPLEVYPFREGRVELVTRIGSRDQKLWQDCLKGHFFDSRFYELLERTMSGQFEHYYLILRDPEGHTRSIQPFFVIPQDLIVALPDWIRRAVNVVRRLWPNFLILRMLMVGCSLGDGSLVVREHRRTPWHMALLHQVLPKLGRKLRVSLVIFKDFPRNSRPQLVCLRPNGYVRMPSIPCTSLDLNFSCFEDYMKKSLSHATRKNLRRKFRDAERIGRFDMEMVTDLEPFIDEIYPLYLQVFERSKMRFEILTRDYLRQLGRDFPERARFFLWRHHGRIVAFNTCLEHEGILRDCYMGMEYPLALEAHLYFVTIRDVFEWGMQNGIKTYLSGPLNYEPKLHLHMKLVAHDVYVRHLSNLFNPAFKVIAPLMGPTRHDPLLRKFRNFHEIL